MDKSWIHVSRGQTPRQAHIEVPDGLKEEEISRAGFQGRVAELYHQNEPTGHIRSEGEGSPGDLDGNRIAVADKDDPLGRMAVLWRNDDLTVSVSRRSEPPPYWGRDCDFDELWFVHRGEGVLETEFGPMEFRPGDYMVVPKGVTQRLVPRTRDNYFLHLRSRGEISFVEHLMLGRHNPYDPDVISIPEPQPQATERGREYELKVLRDGKVTSFFFETHPMDVVGWKGDLFPFKFHNLDFRPVVADRNHVPPTASALFRGEGWILCNFVPAPMQRDRAAPRLPYYHRNVDYDEIGFMHAGAIAGAPIDGATFMWHPRGAVHGPGEAVRALADQFWEEISINDLQAVNIDAVRPLTMSEEARALFREGGQLTHGKAP
jgi:homogentisate 1,2-dioxygenase